MVRATDTTCPTAVELIRNSVQEGLNEDVDLMHLWLEYAERTQKGVTNSLVHECREEMENLDM